MTFADLSLYICDFTIGAKFGAQSRKNGLLRGFYSLFTPSLLLGVLTHPALHKKPTIDALI
jgi:hypothetical protein